MGNHFCCDGNTENEKESDMYVDLYNTICEKYNPVGEHN